MSVLEIMQQDNPYGGYPLLRSEFRFTHDGSVRNVQRWLSAIAAVLTYGNELWLPDPDSPEITVFDLYRNGDIGEEDMRVFSRVLLRYLSYVHEVTKIKSREFLVTLEVEGDQDDAKMAGNIFAALTAHFDHIPFAKRWYVDPIDPEISPSYREKDL